jgi:serine beta-lactamase-like protein LACTB, mitochondrial
VSKRRTEMWLALIVGGIGLVVAAILGLWAYVSITATPLHLDQATVPSVIDAPPLPRWADAVARARQIVRADLTQQNLPGVSVAVGVGDDLVWAEGFGYANLASRTQVTPRLRFRMGTGSKVLTSAAVGLLLEKDQLKLDDEIQTYVPQFPKKPSPVTLRQLMGHLAGVRNEGGDEEPLTVRCEGTLEGLERFADRSLLSEPGTQYHYSSYGWILVSAAVEAVAHEPFFSFMRTQVFEPLRMTATSAEPQTEPSSERATFYFPRFAADPRYGPQEPRETDYSCFSGSSAFLSTPSELVRFGLAIARGALLRPATVHLLQTSQRTASGQETGYGLGWDIENVPLAGTPTRTVGHDGEIMGGMVSSLLTFPEQGMVVTVMANTSYADTFGIASRVAEAFAGQGKSPAR